MQQTTARKKMMVLAQELGLTRIDRLELAAEVCVLPARPASWSDLDDDQVLRVLDAMHGYVIIRELREHHR